MINMNEVKFLVIKSIKTHDVEMKWVFFPKHVVEILIKIVSIEW